MKLTPLSLILVSTLISAPIVSASDRAYDDDHYTYPGHHKKEDGQAMKSVSSTRAWLEHFYARHPQAELLELERERDRLEVKYQDNGMIYKHTYRIQQ